MRGFTLIETVLYIALFTIVTGGITLSSYMLIASSDALQARAMLVQESRFIMSGIERAIVESTTIVFPSVGESASMLTLRYAGGEFGAIEQLGTDILMRSEILNNTNTRVVFFNVLRSSTFPDGVTISITLETRTRTGKILLHRATSSVYMRI
jgi:hypothetical protein